MRSLRRRFNLLRPGRNPKHEVFWLTSDLGFSCEPAASGWPEIVAAGFHGVVDLRAEAPSARQLAEAEGLEYRRLPIEDGGAPDDEDLACLTQWIADCIQGRGAVLVHCREGRGRSAFVACATLVRLGFPLSLAYQTLRKVRPSVVLSDTQAQALRRFAELHGRAY